MIRALEAGKVTLKLMGRDELVPPFSRRTANRRSHSTSGALVLQRLSTDVVVSTSVKIRVHLWLGFVLLPFASIRVFRGPILRRLPRNHFSIAPEFANLFLRSICCEPDNAVSAVGDWH